MKHLQILFILVFTLSIGWSQNESQESEILAIAQEWTDAWNGKIDTDRMMSNYDKNMMYIWRGSAMDYEAFRRMVTDYIAPYTSYDIHMENEVVKLINEDAAVVFFQFIDKSGTDDPGSVSLALTKKEGVWKIISAHEALVRPLPPKDFEEQFNKIAQQYHKDYMNAKCEGILPYLDESLVIHENGEKWPYKKVKEYCPQLPVKTIIFTDRAYKILNDELVYEYVEHKYKGRSGDVFSESQALIWKYTNGSWKIMELGATRYKVKQ